MFLFAEPEAVNAGGIGNNGAIVNESRPEECRNAGCTSSSDCGSTEGVSITTDPSFSLGMLLPTVANVEFRRGVGRHGSKLFSRSPTPPWACGNAMPMEERISSRSRCVFSCWRRRLQNRIPATRRHSRSKPRVPPIAAPMTTEEFEGLLVDVGVETVATAGVTAAAALEAVEDDPDVGTAPTATLSRVEPGDDSGGEIEYVKAVVAAQNTSVASWDMLQSAVPLSVHWAPSLSDCHAYLRIKQLSIIVQSDPQLTRRNGQAKIARNQKDNKKNLRND
jgi:hypothetical protein